MGNMVSFRASISVPRDSAKDQCCVVQPSTRIRIMITLRPDRESGPGTALDVPNGLALYRPAEAVYAPDLLAIGGRANSDCEVGPVAV